MSAPEAPDRPSDPGGSELLASAEVAPRDAGSTEDPADRFLVLLRFVAVGGMAATILVADWLVEGLLVAEMMAVLLAIGGSNLVWLTLLSVRGRGEPPGEDDSGRRYVEAQLTVDVLSLGAMLWTAGGIGNPFAIFLTFQIALAGLLCTTRATLLITLMTVATTGGLYFAPPLPEIPKDMMRLATLASLALLSAILGAFVVLYARRLGRLREVNSHNERLAAMGRLVGSMSHELNTPLATILLVSKDLAEFRGAMPEEELEQAITTIATEAQRANDIVGLVRGHVGPDQALESVLVGEFARELAETELDRLGFSGERRFEIDTSLAAHVVKRGLVQILANLLRNATEATLLGGKRRISLQVYGSDDRVLLAVEDRGPGFAPEILKRLGEPFQTTKGGMGLGLYVSGLLAKQMGASLSVETLRRGGARVVLRMPAASSDGAAPVSEPVPSEPHRSASPSE